MTRDEVKAKKQDIDKRRKAYETELACIRLEYQQLQQRCEHPAQFETCHMGENCLHCPDCGNCP